MKAWLKPRLAVLLLTIAVHLAGVWWVFAILGQQSVQPAPPMVLTLLASQSAAQASQAKQQSVHKQGAVPNVRDKQQAVPEPAQGGNEPSNTSANMPEAHESIAAVAAATGKTSTSAPTQSPASALPIIAPRFDAAYLNNAPPGYPPVLSRIGQEGFVVLRVHVTTEGNPGEMRILTKSSSPLFDEAALNAVRRWRFIPARQGDNAVAAWVQVPITFALK